GLMLVYERIRASRQHFGLIEILNRKVPERQFRDWSMGFTRAPKRVMLQLSQASWSRIVADIKGRPSDNSGLGMLAAFWNQASGREGR
ncbi:MAG: hypothetical protein KDE64_13065, partial [Rhodocyclaceae bacterium]|nr:hypothetical protein [Rhodocyclaceae bacterium]